MGKKKPQKTKELSVAIAEASSTIDETGLEQHHHQQQQPQPQAPRKRGRPRKIIVKMESEEEQEQEQEEKAQAIERRVGSIAAQGTESSMEKGTTNEEEEPSSTCMRITEQEEMQIPKVEPSRSRARRKSKPRKSS